MNPLQFSVRSEISLMWIADPLKTVRERRFQEFVGKSVLTGIPLFLSLPGPRGGLPAKIMLNTDEIHAAAVRRSATLIRQQLEMLLQRLRAHSFVMPAIRH